MATFPPPTAFAPDNSPRAQARAFSSKHQSKTWCSGKLDGREHVVALIFKAAQPVTKEMAQQLAIWVKNQRSELDQGGAMLACTLPDATEFPAAHNVFLRAIFQLLPVPE